MHLHLSSLLKYPAPGPALPQGQARPTSALIGGRNPSAALAEPARQPAAMTEDEPEKLVVMILEGNFRLTGAVLFCLSREPQIVVHMLSRQALSPYRYSRYVRAHHYFPVENSDAQFVAFARQLATETGARVFLPVDVPGMRFTIAHRQQLAPQLHVLPLPTADAYEIATDKGRLAAFMQKHAIPAPDTILDLGPGLADRLARLEFPALLKPVEGDGGHGITLHKTQADLLRAVADLPAGSRYLIQNCLDGYDIDCNVLYQDGQLVAYSIQKGIIPAASDYLPTTGIEFVHNQAVVDVANQLMTALRWNGVAHLDLRFDARTNQIRVIEVNTRFWLTVVGSAITARVNFPVLACRAALGRPILQSAYQLGRYIPFTNFIRYKYGSRVKNKIPFTLRDTSILGFLGDPLPKLYNFFYSA